MNRWLLLAGLLLASGAGDRAFAKETGAEPVAVPTSAETSTFNATTAPPRTGGQVSSPASIGRPHFCSKDDYPASALIDGAEGTTTLSFTIAEDGSVRDAAVHASSGDADLDAAAVACAKTWTYRPAMQDGKAVAVPWLAAVVWKSPVLDGPDYDALKMAGQKCIEKQVSVEEAKSESKPTILYMHIIKGAVESVRVRASGGNPDLDQRLVACWQNLPPGLAPSIADEELYYPFEWSTLGVAMQGKYVGQPPPPPVGTFPGGSAAALKPPRISAPHSCPNYPDRALQTEAQGDTLVAFTIGTDGTVHDPQVRTSSGHADLDTAAIACARDWTYQPATENGAAIAIPWQTDIRWRIPHLEGPSGEAMIAAGRDCMKRNVMAGEVKPALLPTVLHVSIDGGKLRVAVEVSGGDAELDERLAACFGNVPPQLVANLTDTDAYYTYDWAPLRTGR